MNTPITFAEWSDLFDMIKKRLNDAETLEAAQNGTYDMQPITAELWMEEFTSAINERLNLANQRFKRDFSASAGSEGRIIQAISSLKKELVFVYKLSKIPCVPNAAKEKCAKIVTDSAKKLESSLMDSAKSDRSGKLGILIRNAEISKFN